MSSGLLFRGRSTKLKVSVVEIFVILVYRFKMLTFIGKSSALDLSERML